MKKYFWIVVIIDWIIAFTSAYLPYASGHATESEFNYNLSAAIGKWSSPLLIGIIFYYLFRKSWKAAFITICVCSLLNVYISFKPYMERTQFNHSESIFDSQDYNSEPISNLQNKKNISNSSFEDKAAYAIGVSLGTYVSRMKVEQDALGGELPSAAIAKGFNDGLNMNSELSREDIEGTLKALDAKVKEASDSRAQAVAETNLKAGNEFLAKKATEEGVQKTASGLLFKVLAEGKGDKAALGDTVSVIYKGTTIDGTVFDEQTKPVDFPLDNIIPGWIEGLQLMNVGSEYELYIPSYLAYGENAVGQFIKPNSVLIFDITLIGINSKELKH